MLTIMDTMKRVRNNAPEKVKLKSLLFMHYIHDPITSYEAARDLVDKLQFVPNIKSFPVNAQSHQLLHDVPKISRAHIKVVTDLFRRNWRLIEGLFFNHPYNFSRLFKKIVYYKCCSLIKRLYTTNATV